MPPTKSTTDENLIRPYGNIDYSWHASLGAPLGPDTHDCFASHMGMWSIEPMTLNNALAVIQGGMWRPEQRIINMNISGDIAAGCVPEEAEAPRKPYQVVADGIAIIPIYGAMSKESSKYGTSTVAVRRMVRQAVADDDIYAALIVGESPGGHVAGTQELADDIKTANETKPFHAHIEDLGASAFMWAISGTNRITANRSAEVGSLGTVCLVYDQSEQYKKDGIKTHVVSTGFYKGAFFPGAEVPEEHIKNLEGRVNDLNDQFMAAMAEGRKMTSETLKAAGDGRVFIAQKALDLGLIDAVQSLDDSINDMSQVYGNANKANTSSSTARANIDIELAELELF